MKLNIPFYSAFPTPGHPNGVHCVETSLKMILGYFEPEIDYTIEETEKITGKVPEKGSWSFDWSIWFVNHGYFVKHYTVFDFESFKKDGIDYIRQKYGNETADWQLANSDIEHAKSLVDEYLSKVVLKLPPQITTYIAMLCLKTPVVRRTAWTTASWHLRLMLGCRISHI
jgi:hypothetical protein